MAKLIRHSWVEQDGFRRHKCKYCGCLRFWDAGWKRLMYFIENKPASFIAPDCKRVFHCDLITK